MTPTEYPQPPVLDSGTKSNSESVPVTTSPSTSNQTNEETTSKSVSKSFFKQWPLGLGYIAVLALCFFEAFENAGKDKICMAWLLAAVVASQIVVDLYDFPSSKTKGRFSAAFRLVAALGALLVAYSLA
ncbi:hypothetical protein L585_08635 [Pantoea ananatis BRT175]|nr:hypothetical protein L585_08635 [Pantoea ananatis BRT175]